MSAGAHKTQGTGAELRNKHKGGGRVNVVGVISDTHGLLRHEAMVALEGVQQILHAGDVGDPGILVELELIAPVLAVRGNVDCGAWAERLPLALDTHVQETKIHMRHIFEDLAPGAREAQVVITGHSHRPNVMRDGDTLYLNPGSAGPRRFQLPVSVALLRISGKDCEAEIIALDVS